MRLKKLRVIVAVEIILFLSTVGGIIIFSLIK